MPHFNLGSKSDLKNSSKCLKSDFLHETFLGPFLNTIEVELAQNFFLS